MEMFIKETNNRLREENVLPQSEHNDIIADNEIKNNSFSETNVHIKQPPPKIKKEKKRKLHIKLLSGFIFLCVAAATIQTGIYIPVFSDIFSPQIEETKNVVPEEDKSAPLVSVTIHPIHTAYNYYRLEEKYLDISVNPDKDFNDYSFIRVAITDSNGSLESSLFNKDTIEIVNKARFTRLVSDPEENFELKIYCMTEHPEELKLTETKVFEDGLYYLVYTHNTLITF